MDVDLIQLFSIPISIIVAFIFILIIYAPKKKLLPHPDYEKGIPVIEIIKALEKICPIDNKKNWTLFPFEYGCHRCWRQSLSLPSLHNSINLYGSAAKVNSSSESIYSLIGNVTKWPEWNPFCNSQYIVKPFHDKQLRKDNFMEAERIISIIRETNKIQSHIVMYRFHHFSDNEVGWVLLWNSKKLEFLYFLMQPTKDKKACLLTHIMGTQSKLFASCISLVSQMLRNIQDFLALSSLHIEPSLYSSQEESTPEKQPHLLNNNLTSFASPSSAKARKKEAPSTVFILVPFVQSLYQLWERTIEYKLAVKNIESASSKKNPSSSDNSKEKVTDSKIVSVPLRRSTSDVGINPKSFISLSKFYSSTEDTSKDITVPKKLTNSESKDKINKNANERSEQTSEDSDTKNTMSQEKALQKTRLRSLSETAVNNLSNWKCSSKLVNSESGCESFNKLDDVSEVAEDKLLALDEEDNKEMFNSSVSEDFEVIENNEFTENKIASFMTQGNYGAAELQAEVLVASQFLHDMNFGNYQSVGGWMFHSYYKNLCVLKKTTYSQFLTIISFLCRTEITVAPKDIWKLVKCPQFRFICDESVKSVEVLEKISTSQKLIHTYHEMSGFVKKELIDFCLLQTEREEANKYYSCFSSIEYDKCPLVKSVTRGTLRPSGWIVEKVNDDPHKSIVTYVMQGLVSSPDSLFIQELGTIVPQSMHNLKNYITSKPV